MDNEVTVNEFPLTQFIFRKASQARIPLSGTFELSPICNFSCRMCYVRKTRKEVEKSQRPIMTLEQWMRIAEEARKQGLLYILLTGGEPLLWPDFWQLYENLCDMGFLISINTNGSLIDDTAIERFKKRPPRRINITMYGASDETYARLCHAEHSFSKVKDGILKLKNVGIQVKMNCSLTPDNAGDLEKIVRFSIEHDLLLQVADYMFPPIRRDEDMTGVNERFTPEEAARYRIQAYKLQHEPEECKEYFEKLIHGLVEPLGLDESCIDPVDGKVRCRAGKSAFWITWDGYMTPCGMMNQPKVDVSQRAFTDAWSELTAISEQIQTNGTCEKCANYQLCHPCAAMALAETGAFEKVPTYLCRIVQAMYQEAEKELQTLKNN